MEGNFINITKLNGYNFYVPDYQRGYKWGETELVLLLNDLAEHPDNAEQYCLQPIIVKPFNSDLGTTIYHLIDGQQRLTTLYLLSKYLPELKALLSYTIKYDTRPKSREFLENDISINSILNFENWEDFIKTNEEYNNIDIYHFFEVYKAIDSWFNNATYDKEKVLNVLINKLSIIWYNVDVGIMKNVISTPAENVFINFNANKVQLKGSELIKALFILNIDDNLSKELKRSKATELALEWDNIETKLQNDTFWYFLCNNAKYNESNTRIDFLFDLIQNKVAERDDLASYREYEKFFSAKGNSFNEQWQIVKTNFYKLEEWFLDNELYHYVGYLIASNKNTNLGKLLENSKKKNKLDFKNYLLNEIKTLLVENAEEKDFRAMLYSLNYIEPKLKKKCNDLLLLLNVNSFIKDRSGNKFPFELFYKHNWSLEHINPQNPEEFNTSEEVLNWIHSVENFKPIAENDHGELQIRFDLLISEAKYILGNENYEKVKKRSDYLNTIEKIKSFINIQSISNLALLDRNTNSALGNSLFLVKRKLILNFDREGKDNNRNEVFIPKCTKDVFTKTYTPIDNKDINSFFTSIDMESYLNFIYGELYSFYN